MGRRFLAFVCARAAFNSEGFAIWTYCLDANRGPVGPRCAGLPASPLLHRLGGLDQGDDLLADQLVEAGDIGQVVAGGDHVPAVDEVLTTQGPEEGGDCLGLLLVPGVRRGVVLEALDDRGDRGGLLALDILRGDLAGKDVSRGDDLGVVLDELRECHGGLGPDHAGAEPVEPRRRDRASHLGRLPVQGLQAHVQAIPGRRRGDHGPGGDRGGLHAPVDLVLADEVDEDRVDPLALRPVDPLGRGGLDVDNPEPAEEGGVHRADIVLIAMVDRREDPGAGVESHGDAIHVVAELAVEDDLEERLHHLGHRPVELVDHDDHRLPAGPDVPGGEDEGRDPAGLGGLEVGETTGGGLVHRRGADVDVGEREVRRDLAGDLALADPRGTAHEDRDLGGHASGEGAEGGEVHESLLRVFARGFLSGRGFLPCPS